MLNFTASASTLLPSWKKASSRSVKVHVRASSDISQAVAASPTNWPSGVTLTSPQPMFMATHIIS